MRLDPFSTGVRCATISAEFGETFLPFIALPPKEQKAHTVGAVGLFASGRGTIARGHDDHRRQFFLTQSNVEAGELATLTPQFAF